MIRYVRYILEGLAAIVAIVIVCAVLLVWRLNASPISTDFLTPYAEQSIESVVPGSKVHFEVTQLIWDNIERDFVLRARNINIADAKGAEIAAVPVVDIKVSLIGLLLGQIMPKELVIDHAQIKLERTKEGVFTFGGAPMGSAPEAGSSGSGQAVGDISENLSRATFMKRLSVTRATFDVRDVETGKIWSASVPEASLARNGFGHLNPRLKFGAIEGKVKLELPEKESNAVLDVYYVYDPGLKTHSLTATFADVTPAYIGGGNPEALGFGFARVAEVPLSGSIGLVLDRSLAVQKIAAKVHGGEGKLVDPDNWDEPCAIKSLDLTAAYDRVAHTLAVSDTQIDFGGPVLGLKIDGAPAPETRQEMDYTAEIRLDGLPMDRFGAIWPKKALQNPREWLLANLRKGTYDHAEATLKGRVPLNDPGAFTLTDGIGKVEASGANVTYVEGMPDVENVSAIATFTLKEMDVQITGGNLGNLRFAPYTIKITGLADVDQYIDIPMNMTGPLSEVLQLLDHPKLGYAKSLGLSADDVSGDVSGIVDFRFPLLKALAMKDVDIRASAATSALAFAKLIPGIAMDQGNMKLELDGSGFSLDGQVYLAKVPFQVAWREEFAQSDDKPLRRVTAKGTVRDNQWANFGISAFEKTRGPINLSLEMTKPSKETTLYSGSIDMTPAAVSVGMLNWKKASRSPAVLTFAAEAPEGKPVQVTSLALKGAHISANGSATLSPDMKELLSLDLPTLAVGRTNAALNFAQEPGGKGVMRFEAKGASLDVAGLRGGKDPDRTGPRPKEYHIQVGRLFTSDDGVIVDAQGTAIRDQQGWSEIKLNGLADGDTPITIDLTPQPDGRRLFQISCSDFGKGMKGLGFTDAVRHGKLWVSGQSSPEAPRTIKGRVKINGFTVANLPVLMRLLNATSPFGFANLLTDTADFSKFDGDFLWTGDEIAFTRAHAAGAAFGINIDGKVDMNSGNANLQGTLVPFSVVNSVLNSIPLVGDLITGGKDQGVLAVAYEINGPLAEPDISVNPVSLLTPGFIRNIFFSGDDDEENAGSTESVAAP